jgi:dipeptidyl aminopeptidase/acylaminoacyl peptidase
VDRIHRGSSGYGWRYRHLLRGEITSLVLLLQGEDDPVVPRSQAESSAVSPHDHGVPHAVRFFAGEGHASGGRRRSSPRLRRSWRSSAGPMGFEPPGVAPLELSP